MPGHSVAAASSPSPVVCGEHGAMVLVGICRVRPTVIGIPIPLCWRRTNGIDHGDPGTVPVLRRRRHTRPGIVARLNRALKPSIARRSCSCRDRIHRPHQHCQRLRRSQCLITSPDPDRFVSKPFVMAIALMVVRRRPLDLQAQNIRRGSQWIVLRPTISSPTAGTANYR